MSASRTLDMGEKLALYREFWDMKPVRRPMIGFDVSGWFPFQRFSDLRGVSERGEILPGMLDARRSLPDYDAFMGRALELEDDFIKGVSPITAIPWMEGILGCVLRRNGQTVWAVERLADWPELGDLSGWRDAPWFRCYLDFARELDRAADGAYPVGLPILRGMSDLLSVLRGHMESIVELIERTDEMCALAGRLADVLIGLIRAHHAAVRPFHGGHYIEAYCMWAPGPLARLQEDATAVYSPDLYRQVILEADRVVAKAFPYSLIHLHSSSLFLLEDFLSIREIGVYQVNRDVGEMGLPELIPYLKRIQEDGRRLFLRGPLGRDDLALVAKELSPTGLMVQAVTGRVDEARELSAYADRLFGAR